MGRYKANPTKIQATPTGIQTKALDQGKKSNQNPSKIQLIVQFVSFVGETKKDRKRSLLKVSKVFCRATQLV